MDTIAQTAVDTSSATATGRKTTGTPAVDDDTLARAILTFCIDSADALLFATIKGAGDAVTALHLIADEKGGTANRNRLDEVFAIGTAKWGRKVNARGMSSFHHGLERWRERLHQLPSNAEKELRDFFTQGGSQWIIGPASPYWPTQLDDLSIRKDWASPLCLWGVGDPAALTSCPQPLAVVGSRGADDYGRYVARTVAKKAAEQGHLVVSGGAFGIDAAAHWGALDAMSGIGAEQSGRTVAVFAGGLNHIGPERNQPLFERIKANGGALISELCPNTIPEARRFLLRNRIIAGLASTVVVAQARSRSGALNTANWAAELGREVYAAPGNINIPGNTGCNWLIRDHRATILTSVNAVDEICHEGHAPLTLYDETKHPITENNATTESQTAAPAIEPVAESGKENHGVLDHQQCQSGHPSGGRECPPSQVPLPGGAKILLSVQKSTANKHDGPEQTASHTATSAREPTSAQQEVLTAIRRCRRQGGAATHETILAMLNTHRPAGRHRAETRGSADGAAPKLESWNIGRLEGELGEMELYGMLRLEAGTVHIVTHSAKSPRRRPTD